MAETIEIHQSDSILSIEMNRSEVHNAFNEVMIHELHEAFREASLNDALKVVILKASGRSFSAGADLNWMKKMVNYSREENEKDSLALFDMIAAIQNCPIPTLARVQGSALGGGCGLIAACDMAFAAQRAKFGFTEVRLGLIPAVISPFVMQKVSSNACSRYFLTGDRFDSNQAKEMGLVHEIADTEEELDKLIEETIHSILLSSPAAVRRAKKLIREVRGKSLFNSREYVACEIASLRVSEEGQEGLQAFLGKRKPSWLS